jgi:7-cyano-7-deazaguanine synthase in queuosine biosynthesis
MNKLIRNGLTLSLGLLVAVSAGAKDIKIATNNTDYAPEDIQKLASTAVKMGVKEPLNMNLAVGNLTVSGSNTTNCVIKVGTAKAPQIAGISCK